MPVFAMVFSLLALVLLAACGEAAITHLEDQLGYTDSE